MDNTITFAAVADPDQTRDHRPQADHAGLVQIVAASGSQFEDDFRKLLRFRLRLMAGAMVIGITCQLVSWMPSEFGKFVAGPTAWVSDNPIWSSMTVVWASFCGLGGVLWLKPGLSIRSLRAAELVGLSLLACNTTFITYHNVRYAFAGQVPPYTILATSNVLAWFSLMVGYGVVIPNTGRRCMAVVCGLAAVGLVSMLGSWVWFGANREQLEQWTGDAAAWLVFGIAITVASARWAQRSRQEAATARRLGQYVLREKLGAGGMGEVYRAEHALLRRPAAIKLIRPERAGDLTALARFEREVQVTATLTHPNTVQIYDYGRADDGTFYYVMEYLPGLPLDELVRRDGPLDPGRAVYLLRQLCGALNEAHAAGLIHRDIKPGNVMVCDRGGRPDTVKLLDFGLVLPTGLAGGEGQLSQQGAVTGTPAFLSPEQARGDDTLGPAADVYSLGAVAYFVLTGRPPFADRTVVGLLAAHLHETPQPPSAVRPGVPADLEAVILRCLAKAPGERYPTAAALDAALAACGCGGRRAQRTVGALDRAAVGSAQTTRTLP